MTIHASLKPTRQSHRTQTSRPMHLLRLLALLCLPLGLAVPVAAETPVRCDTGQLELPDLDTLKLPDGEHMIAKSESVNGKLEARVGVKGKIVSDPIFYIRGMRLQKTPESGVPKPILECLKKGKGASSCDSWFANAVRSTLDWMVPAAEARTRRCRMIGSGCDDRICCATVCCSSACDTECAYIP